ncbi:MAG TPA: phosphoribosyl-AMP cyclohydrolase, partial [Ignavibacteriales bacterium]|nr:phosphoribosyl-AMP cyclohydrolase [Ignavibacteriales bacterium]
MIDIAKIDFEKSGGLVPAIITDKHSGSVLMLGYMNREALAKTLETGLVTFYSRTKQRLWKKGETSGNCLKLASIKTD